VSIGILDEAYRIEETFDTPRNLKNCHSVTGH
jgi:hypothetical protein